jgi:hypothetical protein
MEPSATKPVFDAYVKHTFACESLYSTYARTCVTGGGGMFVTCSLASLALAATQARQAHLLV